LALAARQPTEHEDEFGARFIFQFFISEQTTGTWPLHLKAVLYGHLLPLSEIGWSWKLNTVSQIGFFSAFASPEARPPWTDAPPPLFRFSDC
jgi:hypothetical protein